MTDAITSLYRKNLGQRSDVSMHLGMLFGLSLDPSVKTVVELGFRGGVSTTALLAHKTAKVHSYDIQKCEPHVTNIKKLAPHLSFHHQSSLEADIPECDLLFIDSLHTYTQLKAELNRHEHKVKRWIAMHDTETFGEVGQDKKSPGLRQAIEEFLAEHVLRGWKLQLHLVHNNGFTLLERSTQQ